VCDLFDDRVPVDRTSPGQRGGPSARSRGRHRRRQKQSVSTINNGVYMSIQIALKGRSHYVRFLYGGNFFRLNDLEFRVRVRFTQFSSLGMSASIVLYHSLRAGQPSRSHRTHSAFTNMATSY